MRLGSNGALSGGVLQIQHHAHQRGYRLRVHFFHDTRPVNFNRTRADTELLRDRLFCLPWVSGSSTSRSRAVSETRCVECASARRAVARDSAS